MNQSLAMFGYTAMIGIGATAVFDIWLQALKRAGVPVQNFAMLGRWIGHWKDGQWHHAAISKAPRVEGEAWLGWTAHYAIGIGFASLLVAIGGETWTAAPSIGLAVLVGIATVAAPLLVMQPALGAGIASSKTTAPIRNTLKSLANHTVFGLGLYIAAVVFNSVGQLS